MLEDDKRINKDSKDQWVFLNARDTYDTLTEANGYRLSHYLPYPPAPSKANARGLGNIAELRISS